MTVDTRGVVSHRIDRSLSIREDVGFFGTSGARLFGSRAEPLDPPLGGLVVCSPIHADAVKQYRREVLFGRALASAGFAVQRFHYRGFGNSDGEGRDVTFAAMRDDAIAAGDELRERAGVGEIVYLGIGWGGLVAAAAVSSSAMPIALWQPVLDAPAFFTAAMRARAIGALKEADGVRSSEEELLEELRNEGSLDVLGYSIDRTLFESSKRGGARFSPARASSEGLAAASRQGDQFEREVSEAGRCPDARRELRRSRLDRGGGSILVHRERMASRRGSRFDAGAHRPNEGMGAEHPSHGGERMSRLPATADDETVTFLEAGAETILAVATNPTAEPLGVGVVVLPGGGAPLTTGRNRFAVRLCRDLASSGFHTIRLDYHGAGESTGSISRLRLDQPFVEDAEAAIRFLRLQGIDRIDPRRIVLRGTDSPRGSGIVSRGDRSGAHLVPRSGLRDGTTDGRLGRRTAERLGVRGEGTPPPLPPSTDQT